MIRVCCVCHRVEQQGKWHAGPFLAEHKRLTHGYCPDCFAGVTAEIEEYFGLMVQQALDAVPRSTAGEQRD